MQPRVIRHPRDLPARLPDACRSMPPPDSVLLCSPEHFRVVDVKNPFMEGNVGAVRPGEARRQWAQLKRVLEGLPVGVEVIEALPDCEDMVFAANPVFPGLDAKGRRVCVPSRMKFPSRRREVPAFTRWFEARGYRIEPLASREYFEGGGDALWHPGRRLIWGGHGPRTRPSAYPELARIFETPVVLLELVQERFYHLDTCFCALDEQNVLIHPPAFSPASLEMIRQVFPRVLEAGEADATRRLACNAAAFGGRSVVIQLGARRVNRKLREAGFEAIEVETGEYLKSGGSVFCMKAGFWS